MPDNVVICCATGFEVVVLDSTSLPLGVRGDTIVPARRTAYPSARRSACAVLQTAFPRRNRRGESRSAWARALQIIRSEREKSARQIIETLHQEVLGFCRGQAQADDITVVVAKVTAE